MLCCLGGLAASIAEKLTGIGWGPQPLRARRKRNMRHVSSCSRAHVPLLSNAPPLSYTLALSLSSLSPSTSPLSQCVSLFINRGRGKQPIPNQWPLARQGDCFYDGAFSMGAARGALCEDRARNLKKKHKNQYLIECTILLRQYFGQHFGQLVGQFN